MRPSDRLQLLYALLYVLSLLQSTTLATVNDEMLVELTERFFRWRLTESPEFGTKVGIHDRDDEVEEYTEEAFTRQKENAEKLLSEAKALDPSEMSQQNRISLEIVKYNLQTFIHGYDYRKFGMYNPVTPMERPPDDWVDLIGKMNFNSEDDYRKYLTRLSKLPTQTGAIESLDQQIQSNSSDFYKPFTEFPSNFTPSLKSSLEAAGQQAIAEFVTPSWQTLRSFIDNVYKPATRTNVSISSLAGGLEFYRVCLKWHTTVDWTPEEIHQKGREEVERIEILMDKIKSEQRFNGTLREFISYLANQPENYFNTEEEMLNGYNAMITSVHGNLSQVLVKVPSAAVIAVKAKNPQSGARYSEAPLDNSRPGEFVVNVFDPHTKPKYNMLALTLHEAEPGHHTQYTYAVDENLPNFRRAIEFRKYNAIPFNWPFHTAYVEMQVFDGCSPDLPARQTAALLGWALYAEALGEEMNAYSDSLELFGRYASELLRACRLVVDTGIHAFGWTKEQAVDYFTAHTTSPPASIDNEINRYISWPGQACAYKIGEIKIEELRRRAENALGDKFDWRQFHHQILILGPAPLSVLEKSIDDWISSTLMPSNAIHLMPVRWKMCLGIIFSYFWLNQQLF